MGGGPVGEKKKKEEKSIFTIHHFFDFLRAKRTGLLVCRASSVTRSSFKARGIQGSSVGGLRYERPLVPSQCFHVTQIQHGEVAGDDHFEPCHGCSHKSSILHEQLTLHYLVDALLVYTLELHSNTVAPVEVFPLPSQQTDLRNGDFLLG